MEHLNVFRRNFFVSDTFWYFKVWFLTFISDWLFYNYFYYFLARTLFLPHPSLSFRQVRHSINNVSWVVRCEKILNRIWALLSHLLIIATLTLLYVQQMCSKYWRSFLLFYLLIYLSRSSPWATAASPTLLTKDSKSNALADRAVVIHRNNKKACILRVINVLILER